MTTTERNDIINQARRRYLAANPPRITTVPAVDATTGQPAGEPFLIPNIGDIQIVGCKLGMEFLAICDDDDAVEEWIHTAMGIVKDPELAGILFANVFRGINIVIAKMIDGAGARTRIQQLAVEAWSRDFRGAEESGADDAFDDPEVS
jgi:hypothetical protein